MESNYTTLMSRRVRRILLVCNNYDSFALEEDGRIDVQIAQEYAELNLSNPPSITRAETPAEALEIVHRPLVHLLTSFSPCTAWANSMSLILPKRRKNGCRDVRSSCSLHSARRYTTASRSMTVRI